MKVIPLVFLREGEGFNHVTVYDNKETRTWHVRKADYNALYIQLLLFEANNTYNVFMK